MINRILILLILASLLVLSACNDNMIDAHREYQDELAMQSRANAPKAVTDKAAPAPSDATITDIVITLAGADEPEFTQLLDALLYTELAGVFTGGEQFTVFAPVDAAFFELYDVLGVDSIRALDVDLVTNVLLYHVAKGRRATNSVVAPRRDRKIQTLLGSSFSVTPDATINAVGNSAGFVSPELLNVSASNGIIHVIDTVLLPIEL
jgi:uncharacterized surface protein with fasciclin (FAS1) repeats